MGEGQFLSVGEWVDLLKGKLFDAVTRLKTSLVEFSHPLDQCSQARCHLKFLSLFFNMRQKEMFVRSLGFDVYVNVKPLLGAPFQLSLNLVFRYSF
jgi:hypothetical protein